MKTLHLRSVACVSLSLFTLGLYATACSRESRSSSNTSSQTTVVPTGATTETLSATQSASVPATIIPDSFAVDGSARVFDARRAYDMTGDGVPETIALHAFGGAIDGAVVTLSILGTAGDTLYSDMWDTRSYFKYTPRTGMSGTAAAALITSHVKAVLADSAFTSDGPSQRLRNDPANKATGGISRDAVLYDVKEHAVRERMNVPRGAALPPELQAEMEHATVAPAIIDTLIAELKGMPTFTYHSGGEVTQTIAWSKTAKRFVRIFSCC